MSFVDLATLTLHRRNELEARVNVFLDKCDHAIGDIQKLKTHAHGLVGLLNCEPAELKERFLLCMKQLDEFSYIITDFNLALGQVVENSTSSDMPEQDHSVKSQPIHVGQNNLMDLLSEPTPSTSAACQNLCPTAVPKRIKVPKKDQLLIAFSNSSLESVPQSKNKIVENEVQSELTEKINNITITCPPSPEPECCNLPAQQLLQADQVYSGIIIHVDEDSFWIITDNVNDVYRLMEDMNHFYKANPMEITLKDISTLTYCAFYDDSTDCFYRALFIKQLEEDMMRVEVFLVDTGEVRAGGVGCVRPLRARFTASPPAARCCHLAGIDLLCYDDKSQLIKQQEFMEKYVGTLVKIQVDDNTSESLGVIVILPTNETLNELLVQNGLAVATDRPTVVPAVQTGPPEMVSSDADLDITQCPEYEDPVEAVTGYSYRDDADICKHYKGGPKKTCFKGARCTKRHVLKHPDGWTLDRVEVVGKLKTLPLPKPGSWIRVLCTYICHFDKLYVQFVQDNVKEVEETPKFGTLRPPTTLEGLVLDMNSPAARLAYKPLQLAPSPGEIVAALYPMDNQWYRAKVLTVSHGDQNVEVMYVDYGNVVWVQEDAVRRLEPRHMALPAQAVRATLAGVAPRGCDPAQLKQAKQALAAIAQDRSLAARVIERSYDELVLELLDNGYSVAEQLAAIGVVELREFAAHDDCNLQRRVVPA